MRISLLLPIFLSVAIYSCSDSESTVEDGGKQVLMDAEEIKLARLKRPSALRDGKFLENEGKTWLYGGGGADSHFDVSNMELHKENFHFGVGRNMFTPITHPDFIKVDVAQFEDSSRFLVVEHMGEEKAYPLTDLAKSRVVNDHFGDVPVLVTYSVLAQEPRVYNREIDGRPLTFAHSGYTYFEEDVQHGLDGFIMWDKETESLWWPLMDQGVSGAFKGKELERLETETCQEMSWKQVRRKYPQAKVMSASMAF